MRSAVRLAHAALVIAASIPWAVGCAGFWLAMWLTIVADRLWPDATHGNCWSYVGPRWRKFGGYMLIRWAERPMQRIPHVIWVPQWREDVPVHQTEPVQRARNWWQAHRTLYFRWRIVDREKSRK